MKTLKVKYLVFLFLFFSPIFFYVDPSNNFDLSPDFNFQQYIFFVFFSGLLTSLSIKNKFLSAFVFLSCVHCAFQSQKDQYAFFSMIPTVLACVCYEFIGKIKLNLKKVAMIFSALLIMNLVFATIQFLKCDVFFQHSNLQPTGLMTLPAYLGMYAVIVAPVTAYLSAWMIPISFACVLISKSVFCVIAWCVSMFIYLWFRCFNRRWITLTAISFCVLGLLYACFDSKIGQFGRRGHIWTMVASKAMRSPFVGHGIGSYSKTLWLEFQGDKGTDFASVSIKDANIDTFKQFIIKECVKHGTDFSRIVSIHFKEPGSPFTNFKAITDDLRGKQENRLQIYTWDQPHNEYLRIFYEFGLLGLLITCGYIVDIFIRFRRSCRYHNQEIVSLFCSFIGLLIVSIVHFPLYLPCVITTSIILLAMLDIRLGD